MDEDEFVLADSEEEVGAISSPRRDPLEARASHGSSSHSAAPTRTNQLATPATTNPKGTKSKTTSPRLDNDPSDGLRAAADEPTSASRSKAKKRPSISPDDKRSSAKKTKSGKRTDGNLSSEDDLDLLAPRKAPSSRAPVVVHSLSSSPVPEPVERTAPLRRPKKAAPLKESPRAASPATVASEETPTMSVDEAPLAQDPHSPPSKRKRVPKQKKLPKPRSAAFIISDDEENHTPVRAPLPSSPLSEAHDETAKPPPPTKTPVAVKPTDPTTKIRTSSAKKPTFEVVIPVRPKSSAAVLAVAKSPAAPPAPAEDPQEKTSPVAAKGKGKGKKRAMVVKSDSDVDEGAFDSEAESAILTGDDSDSDERHKKAKPAKKGAKAAPVAARKPLPPKAAAAKGRPMQRRLSAAEREAAVLKAAEEEVEHSHDAPVAAPTEASDTVDDGEDQGKAEKSSGAVDSDASDKENAAPAKAPPGAVGTPAHAGFSRARFLPGIARSATPGSTRGTPGPSSARGVGKILAKISNPGHRPPGLSSRANIPRLHANLAVVKARPSNPKEKERPKKGKKEYVDSDEEVPWYETKPVEEWDDDDHFKWGKIQKKRERGWSSD